MTSAYRSVAVAQPVYVTRGLGMPGYVSSGLGMPGYVSMVAQQIQEGTPIPPPPPPPSSSTDILTAVGVGHMDSFGATTPSSDRTNFFPTGQFGGSQLNRAWLMFDTSQIPSNATVVSASLDITVSANFLGPSHTLNLYRIKRKCWRGTNSPPLYPLNQGSWNNCRQDVPTAWSTAGAGNTTTDRDAAAIGSLAVTSATAGKNTITLNTALVQEWINGTLANNGMLLQASDEAGTTLMRWLTLDDATPANRPRLTINYTTPATTLLTNLEAFWKLDNVADAVGSHTLTNVNGVTFVSGKAGNAAHFVRASSQALTNNDAALKAGSGDWTWIGWVKLTTNNALMTVAAQWTDAAPTGGKGWRLFYHDVSILDYFVAQLSDDGGSAEVADVVGYNGGNPTVGTYYFVAVRHDSVRKWLHLFTGSSTTPNSAPSHNSGEQWGSYSPATYIPSPGLFMLGSEPGGQAMNGDIDCVGYWSRWLQDSEIATVKATLEPPFP